MAVRSGPLRIARVLTVVAAVVLAVLLVYAGTALYFASKIPTPVRGSPTASVVSTDTLALGTAVTVTNPGPFPITGVTVVAHVTLPAGLPSPTTHLGPLGVGSYSTVTIPATLDVPFQSLVGAGAYLLVNDTGLPYEIWANGSYAGFAGWETHLLSNYSWGAPFYHFLVDRGIPVPQLNGSVSWPLNITFHDGSPLNLSGLLNLTLLNGTGAECARTVVDLAVNSGASFDNTTDLFAPGSCSAQVKEYVATWVGDHLSAALPTGELG